MEKIVVLNDFQLPLRMERAVGNATFDLLRSDRRNFLTFTSDPEDSSALLFRVIPGGWIDQEQISYNRLLDDKVLSGMNLVAGQILPKTIDDGTYFIKNLGRSGPEFVRHHCIIARMILPAIGQAVQKSAYAQTSLDEATLACALERYRLVKGEFPETLTELSPQFIQAMPHDVITGEPLKYHRKQNGEFVLYSVGWNENDDGGKTVILSNGKAIEMTQGDWVWPVYPRE